MKYQIKIAGQNFEVEITDLYTRPIMVLVDGETVEVWPHESVQATSAPAPTAPSPLPALKLTTATMPSISTSGNNANQVLAPIPGVIVSINVQPGTTVVYGQELCVLEAMKMKNAIRATRPGRIDAVHIAVGQQVKHHDVLMDYAVS